MTNTTRGIITILREPTAVIALVDSIRLTQRDPMGLTIMVAKGTVVDDALVQLCDMVVELDEGVADTYEAVKWAAYDATPYDETILVDDDMLVPLDITDWWDLLAPYDLLFCSSALNYMGHPIVDDPYRRGFAQNRLQNIYTALTYFKKSELAETVFRMAKEIALGWDSYRKLYLQGSIGYHPTDDAVFACAIKETGYQQQAVRPDTRWFTHVDMQMKAQGVAAPDDVDQDWTKHLVSHVQANGSVIVQQFLQNAPFKYRVYHFLQSTIIDVLRHGRV